MPPSPNQAAAPWPEAWRAYREQCCGALNLGCSCFLNAAVQALLPVWYNTYGERATPAQPLAKLAAEQMDLPVAPGIRTARHAALNADMATPAAPAATDCPALRSISVPASARERPSLPAAPVLGFQRIQGLPPKSGHQDHCHKENMPSCRKELHNRRCR